MCPLASLDKLQEINRKQPNLIYTFPHVRHPEADSAISEKTAIRMHFSSYLILGFDDDERDQQNRQQQHAVRCGQHGSTQRTAEPH
ncbi:protein of unknown function [Paraburkholderia dioscoreae]|uniref:Uncharacterized protein n=1 Tax=Paraburkholderia dioscoreae TaxID=2604047 RepID=A0A5Q4ZBX6_9BURK|nr:protein of unknown function [Paraburkholderia dioscoreae]